MMDLVIHCRTPVDLITRSGPSSSRLGLRLAASSAGSEVAHFGSSLTEARRAGSVGPLYVIRDRFRVSGKLPRVPARIRQDLVLELNGPGSETVCFSKVPFECWKPLASGLSLGRSKDAGRRAFAARLIFRAYRDDGAIHFCVSMRQTR